MPHGERWIAFGADLDTVFDEWVRPLCQNAQIVARAELLGAWPSGAEREEAAALAWPVDSPLRLMALVASDPLVGKGFEFLSGFPDCASGVVHEVTVRGVSELEMPVEGTVSVALGPGTVEFFDALWIANRDRYVPEAVVRVSLGALAYSVKPVAADSHVTIDKPDVIRAMSSLGKTEGKADDELEPIRVNIAGSRCYIPVDDADGTFLSVVDEVERIEVLGMPFHVVTMGLFVDTEDDEDRVMRIKLYASPSACEGYEPKVGDAIQGALWLQGTIVDESVRTPLQTTG